MTTAVDVNEQFRAGRVAEIEGMYAQRDRDMAAAARQAADFEARVASGDLKPLGNNQFQVVSGWDAGETWTLRQTEFGALLLPEHGLNVDKDGKVALYSAAETWHGAGTVIPGGIKEIKKVLELSGLDFEVGLRPVRFQPFGDDGPWQTMPDKFCTFRMDTGEGLGVVGNIYTPFQNWEAFEFLQELILKFDVVWESAGMTGARVFVSCRLPRELYIDPEGINDPILPFVVFINSHDGSTKVTTCVTPWRPTCKNTERFALRDASARWGHKHDRNVRNKVFEARQELGLAMSYFDKFVDEETALARTEMNVDEFIKTIKEVFPLPDPDKATASERTQYSRMAANLVFRFDANAAVLGRTAYAAERAYTEFLDHRPMRTRRGDLKGNPALAFDTRILEGTDDKTKSTVHRRLMLRVR